MSKINYLFSEKKNKHKYIVHKEWFNINTYFKKKTKACSILQI